MEVKRDNESDMSFGSSSNTSNTSKQTRIDQETIKMGTEPIRKLIPRGFIIHLISILLPQVGKCFEMTIVVRFCGIEAIGDLILLQPIYELISYHMTSALASATNIFTSRNISKNQLVAANIYLAHYFLIAAIWVIVSLVIYFAGLAGVFSSKLVGNYLLLRCPIGCLTCMFSRSVTTFLKSENRFFVIVVRDFIEQLLFIILLVITYFNSGLIGISLTNAGISFIISSGAVAVWMFILIMKISFLDVEYRGVSRFQFRRLSPIRPKIIMQILAYTVPSFLTNATDTLLQLEAVLFVRFMVKQKDYQLVQYVRLYLFTRIKSLLQPLTLAFRDIFQQLAQYNMGIKKITRVFETLNWTIIYMLAVCVPVFVIFCFVAPELIKPFLPVPASQRDGTYEFILGETKAAAIAGAWSNLLPLPYYMVIQMLQLESKLLLSAILQLPMLGFGLGYMYYVMNELADNAPLYLVIALTEVVNAIVGWGFLTYFYVKYYKLNKLNSNAKDVKKNETAIAASNDIRKAVMLQLTSKVEVEDPKKARDSVMNIFNKGQALRQSKDFMSLRESVSTNLRASEMRVSQQTGTVLIEKQ